MKDTGNDIFLDNLHRNLRFVCNNKTIKEGKLILFNFSDFYGKNIGDSFIEIHHIKPIFKFKQDDLSKTLKQAINKSY